jgi:FAD/FMN-containing dehydrogenase
MSEDNNEISRRSLLKNTAITSAGLVMSGDVFAARGDDGLAQKIERVDAKDEWFAQRAYCLSGNKVLTSSKGVSLAAATYASQVYRPRSAQEIAELVKSLPGNTPIACVCGGHESSNAAMFASREAIVLDLVHLKSIEFQQDDDQVLVTVGAGVVFRELVEAVKSRQGALPVGTGPDVGVVGYIVNGGLSGYFSRRLGLLGQRVVKLTMVSAMGDIRVLTPADELFTAMLGAGSALGIVVDMTIRMDSETILQSVEQRVISFETREQAVQFSRSALRLQRDKVLPNESVSMELVVSGTKALVATVVFYDSFKGKTEDFVQPLEDLATELKLPIVMKSHWTTWYEAAAALWPVIAQMKGSPLAMLQHCVGTKDVPDNAILDFVCETIIAQVPLDQAKFSIVEIRTLGGAVRSKKEIPSGNCHHQFFVDMITLYDAKEKTVEERKEIADLAGSVVNKARKVSGLSVDFSGTHSQPDDAGTTVSPSNIFGSEVMANKVKELKKELDPENRFRFHPFAKIL